MFTPAFRFRNPRFRHTVTVAIPMTSSALQAFCWLWIWLCSSADIRTSMISLILVGLSSNTCNQEMYFCFQGTLRGKYLYIYYTYTCRSHDYYRRLNSSNSYFVYYCDIFVYYFDTCNNVFQIFLNHFNTMRTILQIKKYFPGGGGPNDTYDQ